LNTNDACQHHLDFGRIDVGTTRDDEIVPPASEIQESIFIEFAKIAKIANGACRSSPNVSGCTRVGCKR
jgi:hypothetical protein